MAATHFGPNDWIFGWSANVTLSNGNTEPAYLHGMVLTDSTGAEYNTGNPLPVSATFSGTSSMNLAQVGGTTVVTAGVNGLLAVGGNAASGATDSGNPVKVGGSYTSGGIALTTGQRGDLQLNPSGYLITGASTLAGGDTFSNSALRGFTSQSSTSSAPLLVAATVFDGTQFIRQRANTVANGGALLTELGPYSVGRVTADGQIKGSAGFIHTITVAGLTATPTAGLLTVYNSLTETGTVVYSEWVPTTVVGHTVTLDVPCGTGIFVGFDATLANVQVTVSYR